MEPIKTNLVRFYAVEDEEIYQEIYKKILPSRGPIELLEISDDRDTTALRQAIKKHSPDVVLISIKEPNVDTISELEKIRKDYPKIGIILLLESCSSQDIQLLRMLALRGNGGMAFFSKQSLDLIDRLGKAISAVSQGQLILDLPLATFIFDDNPEAHILNRLTPRELEILNLLAQGETNATIARSLYIDIKTVEHHINSMYALFRHKPEYNGKHLRVSAAKLYLEAISGSALNGKIQVRD